MNRLRVFVLSVFLACMGIAAFAQPQVPSYAVFAGDTVRFDTADKYERMDRELLAFTYTHQTSVLMLKRSARYFEIVAPIMKKYSIPDDLKYLMVIESNLDPRAVSTAGAAGLWQFTKATAQTYGLEVNANVDERYNIEKETEAACKYLKNAYEKFGNWMTVAASYNAGIAGITKRLEQQKQKNALELWLTVETSRYMYRLIAAKMMFENPLAFGFNVPDRYPSLKVKQVVTTSEINLDLVALAAAYSISYADLKRANLWIQDVKLLNPNHKTYKIIIPDVGL